MLSTVNESAEDRYTEKGKVLHSGCFCGVVTPSGDHGVLAGVVAATGVAIPCGFGCGPPYMVASHNRG